MFSLAFGTAITCKIHLFPLHEQITDVLWPSLSVAKWFLNLLNLPELLRQGSQLPPKIFVLVDFRLVANGVLNKGNSCLLQLKKLYPEIFF